MEPTFVIDLNLGRRLAKWLRAMGYDALYVPDVDDRELVHIAREQGRIILTKDNQILERRLVTSGQIRAILVRGNHRWEQLRHLTEELALSSSHDFTRCIQCNVPLLPLSREQARDRVPPYVFRTQAEFQECPSCGRVYWRGTHWSNMKHELEQVLDPLSP